MANWIKLFGLEDQGSADENMVMRSRYERDYDRIIFSQPFRRLQDKTQVHPLPESNFVHTRLTHSLEVSSVARSLGRKAGEILCGNNSELKKAGISVFDFSTVTAAAGLCHDIGNPPFGHSGEDAISEYFKTGRGQRFKEFCTEEQWAELTSFEGNAQGFRLAKNKNLGIMLTDAVLGAFTKYPCSALARQSKAGKISQKKYGFFSTERDYFEELANTLGLIKNETDQGIAWQRHPLAYLVEAADDICYHIIDLEDACRLEIISFEQTRDFLVEIIKDKFDQKKFDALSTKEEKLAILRAMSINALVEQAGVIFAEKERQILNGKLDHSLFDILPSKEILNEIKHVSIEKIYRNIQVVETEVAGFEVVDGLLNKFIEAGYRMVFDKDAKSGADKRLIQMLPELNRINVINSKSPYEMIREIIDMVSGLSDSHAVSVYRKITGQTIPGMRN
ncbi:dGTP triphosphohydrolase [Marinigracilibium pacificum]|uniref:DNTP triphosphohydrolase n=1 Tax=Marinigracilibium pacificum TaxID=2729599 RepID=A0A848IUV0_9BACT|nr:dNTP triphosphohydrolase [Marinigracilibium pacificum]NMM46968.1 dNTP triphosphohydrolase [Marinigracilibium pacificum]